MLLYQQNLHRQSYSLGTNQGSYTITGVPAMVLPAFKLNQLPLTVVIDGAPATVLIGYRLALSAGNYPIVGLPLAIKIVRSIGLSAGSLTETGFNARVAKAYNLPLNFGSYNTTGAANKFLIGVSLQPGAYSYSGNAKVVSVQRKIDLSFGVYTTVGAPLLPAVGRSLQSEYFEATVLGSPVTLLVTYDVKADLGVFDAVGADSSLCVSRKLEAAAGVYSITQPLHRNFAASARGFTITGEHAQVWVSHHAYNPRSHLNHKEAAVGGLHPDYPGKLDPFIKAVLGIWCDEEELQTELLSRGGLQTYGYRNYPEIEALLRRREEDREEVEEIDEITINISLLERLWKRYFKSKRHHDVVINAKFKKVIIKPEPEVSVVAHLKINKPSQIKFVVTLKE